MGEERRIVVSIDFGTTFSGVAWAETTQPDVQHVLSDWPSVGSSQSSPKVPTELRKIASGWQWGFQIPKSAKRSRFFKLRLDEPSDTKTDGESAQELTRIYLSCLYAHFISVLEGQLSPSIVQSTPMDVVVTVPAIWSNSAKQETENAASLAGFGGENKIKLISEPEAAALYTVKYLSPSVLQTGRRFVVCDAGGGTVDLITYEVAKVQPLQMREVTEGTGGKCGSSMLNMRFRRYLKQAHGDKYWTDERLVIALSDFESFKKDFSPKGEPLTLKVDPSLGLRRNRFTISQDDMTMKIWDPIMKDIICLINEQISMADEEVAAVVLVGGFGQSKYLKSRVRDAIISGVRVLQPENGVTAVVKGAVIYGLGNYQPAMAPVGIASRVARRSYGTCLLAKYDPVKHDRNEAFWSDKEEEWVVIEMCWFIRKGQSYPEGKPSKIEYQCDIPVFMGHKPQADIEIFSNDDDLEAPTHISATTKRVATLFLDLHKIPKSAKTAAKKKKLGWHRYYCLTGVIEASYGSAMITYTVKLGGESGPPPSTLAAQLVESIAASSKVSRSDENSELKGLLAIIQRVKDNPELLKSTNDRLEHNHMLIYVYCRVVLENIKLDDPFLDRANVRTESQKAINFLRFTIKETPSVLLHQNENRGLLFRGHEPLWVWLLPQLLRLLGHPQCLELDSSIEGFLQYILLIVARTGSLWKVAPFLGLYLRASLTSLLDHLQSPSLAPSHADLHTNLELPPSFALDQILDKDREYTTKRISYSIYTVSQGLRLASSLARVLAYPLISPDPAFSSIVSLLENGPWLIDSYLDLRHIQKRWELPSQSTPLPLIELTMDIIKSSIVNDHPTVSLIEKSCALLILLCSEMISPPDELVQSTPAGEQARSIYCMALIVIAQASLKSYSIGRFAASKLVQELILLSSQFLIIGEDTDIWVSYGQPSDKEKDFNLILFKRCVNFLRQAIGSLPQESFGDNTHPSKFQDDELRKCIQDMRLNYDTPNQIINANKRRKLSEETADYLTTLTHGIYEALQVAQPADDDVVLFEQIFLRLVLHCEDAAFLNLETSGPGQWCLQSLNSSIRELRISAGRTLALFMPPKPNYYMEEALLSRNRKNSIALLKSVSEADPPPLIETRILAWGQLGRVVTEDELNLVLIKLLDYLGSSNNIESAFAFNELLSLAEARRTTPRRLFEPFWKSLAYMATKDIVQRPQRSRAIAELLQISVNELLLLIQSHALPWLVLDKRKDVIQKIAEARHEAEIWRPLMDSHNTASVLSLLMLQESESIEEFVKSSLDEISPHFHALSLADIVQSEPVLTAIELLKAAADADASRKRQVMEQRSCIRALEEMIRICQAYARIARPQISACLLSAASQDSLREPAISCWAAMLKYFDEEDVEALLEATFFIVKRYWPELKPAAMATIRDMLDNLLEKYEHVVEKYIAHLPSLSHIEALRDIETKLNTFRPSLVLEEALQVFSLRISHDYSGVVHQALVDLAPYLRSNQSSLYTSAISQRPDNVIATILRTLLDCACKYNGVHIEITRLCVECVGLIGCLDSNRIEAVREQRSIVVLDNFEVMEEATDFVLFLLQEVLVPSFLSTTDMKLQGFLSYAMQELLERCEIRSACTNHAAGMTGGSDIYRKWMTLPEYVREVVAPFLNSRYMVAPMNPQAVEYPIFHPGRLYGNWLRAFVVDLLRKGQHPHADMIFEPLTRIIRVKDLSTAEFLFPYLVLHVLLGPRSSQAEKDQILGEIMHILNYQPSADASYQEKEDMKRFCHVVFRFLDYAMRWIHAKRSSRLTGTAKENVSRIQGMLDNIPAELISQRAIDCNEYARALFHLEQHAQKIEQVKREPGDRTRLLQQLQDIYANIDEPDGLEGISAHLHVLDINQQILSHKKAGRWTAAQTWYEMQLAEKPDNAEVQIDLLNCLKQAGQHAADVLLNHIEGMRTNSLSNDNRIMPFAIEAAWVTGRWESLDKFINRFQGNVLQDFNMSLGVLFESLYKNTARETFIETARMMKENIALSMTSSTTASLQAAHEIMLKCHVLTDLEIIIGTKTENDEERIKTISLLEGRCEVIGAYFNDRQYVLGIQRAAMQLLRPTFTDLDISGLWLASSRLARKTNSLHQSFNAVLHASQLGDDAATIENAKLLFRDSHHRKAIQLLQGAIEQNKFMTKAGSSLTRAQLLLAKWLDAAGQTHAGALREKYQQPPKTYSTWEKGHYYLGRHYKKILESEQPLKVDDQSDNYVTGEIARLVIENYVRSLNSGTKYLYQTLPRILTLWLDLGAQVDKAPEGKVSLSRELHKRRLEQLGLLHSFLDKYIHRLPAYIFYTALSQIVARIAHPNANVFERLTHIIVKVVEAHPRQALWSLIGIMTTRQVSERKARGSQVLQTLRSVSKKVDGASYDLKYLIRAGEKLAEQLLLACHNGDFHGNKTVHASLTKDLRFNQKCTPCPLVVPVESSLTATLPAVSEHVKKHKAFSRDVVSIDCFLDDVLVLSSLAKPRRLTARGSDGKSYMLLIKPKDDLRTDQRLMEFNGIINRSLKRDAESSKRQLYIRTYAVVPLNEECGIIEWVPGIKTMRDILLNLYSSQKIHPDYNALKQLMEEASTSESKVGLFTNDVLGRFPPVLPLWFIQQFPNPSAWFSARLRYTRSCAVMSMVGTILGLGDRHGENVNLEEGSGGVFHVDFNCLFDKGLTFAKPERVPFRLTHNMVAAMGVYGYEGPFRKSSELTLSILRQQEETLVTILEAFIYDPTLDLQKDKRASKREFGVKLQPQSVVDSIKRKVKGLLPNESIPLSVEGQVEELIKQAVNPRNLAAMYIGWCPFL
ncbi:phosphatidyl inositol 3-kinase [Trichoderma arundinaceum]|uniref:Serine/threonine-protein kinase MEC1 n=1 Tax=Trichoderma arundinaceum TaxID=490622 RepID=A0A395NPC5_TRIAR|nr:phosphatidyl inositol 3-kinase [Trichoderma arundinaceum]